MTVPAPHGGFPQAQLVLHGDAQPVEVSLIAPLPKGMGDVLIAGANARQRAHPGFVDALDEPSVRLGARHGAYGDNSTLFAFAVGSGGHPFHRHAGQRMFTAVIGSGGACLRFSHGEDAASVRKHLRSVQVPADTVITVRFGKATWHQFLPVTANGAHPTLFALSCHPDEFAGVLNADAQAQVAQNKATLAGLTELMPSDWSTALPQRCAAPLQLHWS